jgi:hypothetical protein
MMPHMIGAVSINAVIGIIVKIVKLIAAKVLNFVRSDMNEDSKHEILWNDCKMQCLRLLNRI